MVEPGGLRDKTEVKILICYLLSNVDMPLSFENINEIMQRDGLVNYFEFTQAMHELLMSGHIDLLDDELYKITPHGRKNGQLLYRSLPLSVKEKAIKAAIRIMSKIKRDAENICEIVETNAGFKATCRIMDRDDELMSVSVLLADRMQAESIKNQFMRDPEIIYKGMLALLTGDIETVGGILMPSSDEE